MPTHEAAAETVAGHQDPDSQSALAAPQAERIEVPLAEEGEVSFAEEAEVCRSGFGVHPVVAGHSQMVLLDL